MRPAKTVLPVFPLNVSKPRKLSVVSITPSVAMRKLPPRLIGAWYVSATILLKLRVSVIAAPAGSDIVRVQSATSIPRACAAPGVVWEDMLDIVRSFLRRATDLVAAKAGAG